MKPRSALPFRVPAVVVAALVLTAACGGGTPRQPAASNQEGAVVREADNLPDNLSGYQRKILGDGVLTAAEYEQAALDVVRCHRENGARIVGPPHYAGEEGVPDPWWTPRGQFMYGASYGDDPSAEQKYHACEGEYFSTIDAIWTNHIGPTPQEMQEARDIVAGCLRDAGIDVPEHPSMQELAPVTGPRRDEPEVKRCLRLGADHIGMPAFIA